jgi:hypothetical protein
MNDEDLTQALNRYRLEMTEKSADQKAQKAEKEADEVAMKLVDAAGNWAGCELPASRVWTTLRWSIS